MRQPRCSGTSFHQVRAALFAAAKQFACHRRAGLWPRIVVACSEAAHAAPEPVHIADPRLGIVPDSGAARRRAIPADGRVTK